MWQSKNIYLMTRKQMKRGAVVKHHDQKQLTEEFILAYIPQGEFITAREAWQQVLEQVAECSTAHRT